jgi:predicted TPR repeat methyltransferase
MDNKYFASFYDKQSDYDGFRNDPVKREEYAIKVDWKVRKLIQHIPDGFVVGNILEVGCAFGVLLNNIADRLHIKTRTGIDISGNNIEVAKNLFPECNFFKGTLEEFLYFTPDEKQKSHFDLIVLSDIVEHIPDDLDFLKTVKKSASYVLLNLPLEKSFKTRNRKYGENDPSGHLRSYNEAEANQLVTNAGFEVMKSFTSVSFFDKQVYETDTKTRNLRVRSKPLPLRLFWSFFYFGEDKVKLLNESFSEKIYGTNYFALLKSKSC